MRLPPGCVALLSPAFFAVDGAQPAAPALAPTRELRIDGVAENLVSPSWMVVRRDGRIAVAQSADGSVSFFSPDGKLAGKFGSKGQGPGEFQSLAGAGWVGDSLWVHDLLARKNTLVTPTLTLARTSDLALKLAPASPSWWPSGTTSTLLATYGDGTSLRRANIVAANAPANFDTSGFHLFRVSTDGIVKSHVAHITGVPSGVVTVNSGGVVVSLSTPFYARPAFRVSGNGARVASLVCVYEGQGANTMRLTVLGASGDTVFSRNYSFAQDNVPRATADSALARILSQALGTAGMSVDARRSIQERMKIPPYYAPFTNMLIGDDGSSWIVLRSPPNSPKRIMVLDARGNVVGNATVSANTRPMAITATHMWGVELDQDDVPSIVRYRITGTR